MAGGGYDYSINKTTNLFKIFEIIKQEIRRNKAGLQFDQPGNFPSYPASSSSSSSHVDKNNFVGSYPKRSSQFNKKSVDHHLSQSLSFSDSLSSPSSFPSPSPYPSQPPAPPQTPNAEGPQAVYNDQINKFSTLYEKGKVFNNIKL